MAINKSPTISDILLQNGTASLKDFYPLTEVKTMADKESLATKGYAPGYTASEWPYRLPADKIYYSKQIFPCTYYYDPYNAAIPIALNLNIYGTRRLPTIKDDKVESNSSTLSSLIILSNVLTASSTPSRISSLYSLSSRDGIHFP